MNWLSLSDIKQHLGTLKRRRSGWGEFDHIVFPPFHIEPFAGHNSSSVPKKDLPSLLDYQEISLHIWSDDGKSMSSNPLFQRLDWVARFDGNISNFVPLDIVCQIIKDIYRVTQLNSFS